MLVFQPPLTHPALRDSEPLLSQTLALLGLGRRVWDKVKLKHWRLSKSKKNYVVIFSP